jgi:peptidoglycan hydrolase-like protein with peptidoglycan-binding domain
MADEEIVSNEDTPARRRHGGLERRRRALVIVVVGSVVLTGAAVAAASLIKSPAQAAADTRPPPASVLTVAVQEKVLAETVVIRGEVAAAQQIAVSGEGAGGKDVGRSIVTEMAVQAGRSVGMGQVLLEVSGRPVFVLKGAVPAYRDLRYGSTGEDVAQLQEALAELGHASGGDPAGTFGAGTERAVRLFYEARGFDPVTEMTDPAPTPSAPKEGASQADPAAGTASSPRADAEPAPVVAAPPVPRPVVPMAEITYIRAEPAFVEQVLAQVGDEASGDLVSIAAGDLVVNGSVGAEMKGLLRAGQKVSIASESTGTRAEGTIESVADKPVKPQKDAERSGADTYPVKVKPSGRLPAALAGEDVRLTITAASSGRKVLAVPVSAVSAGADGQTTVLVRRGEQERRVVVGTGMTADGYVQISPEEPRSLAVGDRVVVGVDEQRATGEY